MHRQTDRQNLIGTDDSVAVTRGKGRGWEGAVGAECWRMVTEGDRLGWRAHDTDYRRRVPERRPGTLRI